MEKKLLKNAFKKVDKIADRVEEYVPDKSRQTQKMEKRMTLVSTRSKKMRLSSFEMEEEKLQSSHNHDIQVLDRASWLASKVAIY